MAPQDRIELGSESVDQSDGLVDGSSQLEFAGSVDDQPRLRHRRGTAKPAASAIRLIADPSTRRKLVPSSSENMLPSDWNSATARASSAVMPISPSGEPWIAENPNARTLTSKMSGSNAGQLDRVGSTQPFAGDEPPIAGHRTDRAGRRSRDHFVDRESHLVEPLQHLEMSGVGLHRRVEESGGDELVGACHPTIGRARTRSIAPAHASGHGPADTLLR